MFEFIRIASLDPSNLAVMREAYWMIMYIYLAKTQSIDISESFQKGGKVRSMLKDIDVRRFNFCGGFLQGDEYKVGRYSNLGRKRHS